MSNTIFALSSGGLPSGVAIIRISGPQAPSVVEEMCRGKDASSIEFGNPIGLSKITDIENNSVIDEGLVLSFVAPNSFTGEDVVEFQIHGGRAIVDAILASLGKIEGLRHAEAGEFTYRAFENGKLDLTQAEGIGDLIASETEAQRKLAYDAVAGQPRKLVEDWLNRLVSFRAMIEAEIDFVDEDDIPGSVSDQVWVGVDKLIAELDANMNSLNAAEIIRNGFRVTLLGKPNSGKSTLLNCLAGRDVAIVTDLPGTTRDVLEVKLNLGGQVVIISDTAGIHDTQDIIEKEGIRRAHKAAEQSQMTVWLHAADDDAPIAKSAFDADLVVLSKLDIATDITTGIGSDPNNIVQYPDCDLAISSHGEQGINSLVGRISDAAKNSVSGSESVMFSHERQKRGLFDAFNALIKAKTGILDPLEIRAESLRVASDALGKLVGTVDVEDILGVIFSKFCVGK